MDLKLSNTKEVLEVLSSWSALAVDRLTPLKGQYVDKTFELSSSKVYSGQ